MVKTTKITVETEGLTIVRKARTLLAWCPDCQAEVEMILLDGHATAGDLSASQLEGWLATDRLHVWRPAIGPAQICLTSLLRCFESEQARNTPCEKERP